MPNEELWKQLLALDASRTARRAKCQYADDPPRHCLSLLNSKYTVDLSAKKITSDKDSSQAPFIEELCILAYLINAQNLPIADKLTPPQALPGGQFFFRGLHKLGTEELEKTFGPHPERLYQAAKRFAAKKRKFGDASIELYILPRVPLTIVIWRADDQFPARASILFDQTAASQLPLDALWAATNLTVKTLIKAAEKSD